MEVFECDVNTQELERLFDDRKLTIINDHYFNGKSLRDISVALDLSPSRVSQLHTEILLFLRKKMDM
ncbi:sigma factor-like helix-turn-helix DNA-binding protein [Vibrio chagasii]